MNSTINWLMGGLVLAGAACGGSYSTPVQRSADAQAATRAAQEVAAGTSNPPSAQLHLRLAQDGIARARALMAQGENRKADFALVRAKADAELALALARQESAQLAAQQAVNEANAVQTSTTRSGSSTEPKPAPMPAPMPTTMPGGTP
jgi:multidrug efflux pump subunit AcrA (membrane-fusion protein)